LYVANKTHIFAIAPDKGGAEKAKKSGEKADK
jgi:hypothetical protein